MTKENKMSKLDSILTKLEYGLIAISAGLISFYINIIALTLLSKRWFWLNNDYIAWPLIIIVSLFSLYIAYITWRKIDKSTRWATLKINIIMYHLDTVGQNILFLFIWSHLTVDNDFPSNIKTIAMIVMILISLVYLVFGIFM